MTRALILALGILSSTAVYVPPAQANERCANALAQYDVAYREWAAWCNRGGRTSCPYPGGPEGQRLNYALDHAEAAVRRECH